MGVKFENSTANAVHSWEFYDCVFNYSLYGATIAFSMTVGGFFFVRNAMENIGYSSFGTNIVFMVSGVVASLLTARLWGRLRDRWGRRPGLILCTAGVVFSPIGWFVIPTSCAGRRLTSMLVAPVAAPPVISTLASATTAM